MYVFLLNERTKERMEEQMNTEENACLLDRFDSTRFDSQDTEFRTWRAADDEGLIALCAGNRWSRICM
jgi:hypothetical protein